MYPFYFLNSLVVNLQKSSVFLGIRIWQNKTTTTKKTQLNSTIEQGEAAERYVPLRLNFYRIPFCNACGITESPQFSAKRKQVLELPGKLLHTPPYYTDLCQVVNQRQVSLLQFSPREHRQWVRILQLLPVVCGQQVWVQAHHVGRIYRQ